ncbi:ATP-dependent RNA helicase, putative [Plasmodium ovale]|uniref:RNA helicase n=1 Tax=Plasmodium ovale TaxID=36330 RepID=A0A1C3KMS7_PLAOA|nr:ATP-dependent RNA helicase, putative [Plasmodium ovale]
MLFSLTSCFLSIFFFTLPPSASCITIPARRATFNFLKNDPSKVYSNRKVFPHKKLLELKKEKHNNEFIHQKGGQRNDDNEDSSSIRKNRTRGRRTNGVKHKWTLGKALRKKKFTKKEVKLFNQQVKKQTRGKWNKISCVPSGRSGRSERRDRSDRSERRERRDRSDRSDRSERRERRDRSDRSDRSERRERRDRSDRTGEDRGETGAGRRNPSQGDLLARSENIQAGEGKMEEQNRGGNGKRERKEGRQRSGEPKDRKGKNGVSPNWQKRKRKKEEEILNMFEENLNQSIEKLNVKSRKYDMVKNKENAKSDIRHNYILRKVLSADHSVRNGNRTAKKGCNKREQSKKGHCEKDSERVWFIDDIGGEADSCEEAKQNNRSADKKSVKFYLHNGVRKESTRKESGEESAKESEKEKAKESEEERAKESKKERAKESEKERAKESKKERAKESKKERAKESKKERAKESKKERAKESEEESAKESKKERAKESKKESAKESKKEKRRGTTSQTECDEPLRARTQEEHDKSHDDTDETPGSVIRIGESIDSFRKKFTIRERQGGLSKEQESVKKRLSSFSSIIDMNAKTETANNTERTVRRKQYNFEDLGIYDNFINVYLRYNKIKNATHEQRKYIPMILFFLNNVHADLKSCLKHAGVKSSPAWTDRQCTELASDMKGEKVEQVVYVNKYHQVSGHFVRTFFLHCPTGTGKTFMYLLPLFQHISNLNFYEQARKKMLNKQTSQGQNDPLVGKNSFYETKKIGSNVTSLLCQNEVDDEFFINRNGQYMKRVLSCISGKGKGQGKEEEHDGKHLASGEGKKEMYTPLGTENGAIMDHLKMKKKNDILILTYNKELAVQIYELYKDIINSFYKSLHLNFFENNCSVNVSKYIEEEHLPHIERLNVRFKKKLNMNVHLLIGGNNITYQVKSLKKKKANVVSKTKKISTSGEGLQNCDMELVTPVKGSTTMHCSHENGDFREKGEEEKLININIYVGTPGRIHTLTYEKKLINLEKVETVVLDEYDFFFHIHKKGNKQCSREKIEIENKFFSKLLKSIYLNDRDNKQGNFKNIVSCTNVICCSATPAVYSYLRYTKHIITTNFLKGLLHKVDNQRDSGVPTPHGEIEDTNNARSDPGTTGKVDHLLKGHTLHIDKDGRKNTKDGSLIGYQVHGERKRLYPVNNEEEGKAENTHPIDYDMEKGKKNTSPIDYEEEENMLNKLFKLKETVKIPNNLIHLNYCYDKTNKEGNNNAISNFLRVLFSNPLNKNILVFCNTKKRVMDLWSLFRNRFDVDIQTIFAQKEKKKKTIFKDINYANFFKNDLINYKNLKKYVNFLFISTNLLYRGINCMGFTTIVNFDMPSGLTEYVHRCGRIGRINNKGAIINIFDKQDKRKYNKQIFNKLNVNVYDIDCYMNNMFTLEVRRTALN